MSDSTECPTVLAIVNLKHRQQLKCQIQQVLRRRLERLYLYFNDFESSTPSTELLCCIASIYDAVAVEQPCLQAVPLLPFAGWTRDAVLVLGMERPMVIYTEEGDPTLESMQHLWAGHMEYTTMYFDKSAVEPSSECMEASTSSMEVQGSYQELSFDRVAVGGTFDRLHAGHRTLLAACALVTTKNLYMGITGDVLLVNKKHKELLEGFEARVSAAAAFVQAVRPGLRISSGPLLDPKARTMAAADPNMDALVVSQETLTGGKAINEDRREQGFRELVLVVVNLVGSGSKALGGQKLSSTGLREKEASRNSHPQTRAQE